MNRLYRASGFVVSACVLLALRTVAYPPSALADSAFTYDFVCARLQLWAVFHHFIHDMKKGDVSARDGILEKWSWGAVALYYHRNILLALYIREPPRISINVLSYLSEMLDKSDVRQGEKLVANHSPGSWITGLLS